MFKFISVFVISIFLSQVLTETGMLNETTKENKGFKAIIGERNYFFSKIHVNFVEAALVCNDLGMDLVAFETEPEFDLIKDYIRDVLGTTQERYITRGIRVYTSWLWGNSGPEINYSGWAAGQPDLNPSDMTTQGCLNVLNSGWDDDVRCDSFPYLFICEEK